jgi:phosphoglycolate phosphatase
MRPEIIDYVSSIVWDLDGTLIDSAPDLRTALNELLREHGLTARDSVAVRSMIGDGVAKLVERGFAASGHIVRDAQLPRLVRQFMTIYAECATDQTLPYPGALDALQQFRDAGIRQGICTNKPETITRQVLNNLSLAKYFDAVVGGDTTPKKKPDPLPLRDCLQVLGVNPIDSLMIGDSAVDVATARAVNMPIGLVTHGYAREPIENLPADFLIHELSSLPGMLLKATWPEAAAR